MQDYSPATLTVWPEKKEKKKKKQGRKKEKKKRNNFYWIVPQQQLDNVSRFSRVQLFVTPQTVDHQAPLSVEFSRSEYWSGEQFPSPGDLSDSGIEPRTPALEADSLPSEPPGEPTA